MKRFCTGKRVRSISTVLACGIIALSVVSMVRAQGITPTGTAPAGTSQTAAPAGGGYTGDFGSDFGVGQSVPRGLREPFVVMGIRGVANGKNAPWLGLRLADELARALRAPMRRSADAAGVSQFLAERGVSAWQVSPSPTSDAERAAHALRTWPTYRTFPLLVVGEVTLRGKENAPTSTLQVRVRALRWEKSLLRAASDEVGLQARLGEWPQLPARTSLALLDALQVPLIEDERISFLRTASPLQPMASVARLNTEKLLGQMEYEALRCHLLNRLPRTENAAARIARARAAYASSIGARQKLAALGKIKFFGDLVPLRETTPRWRTFVITVSREATMRRQALPATARKTGNAR
jgi:hypothetical protein